MKFGFVFILALLLGYLLYPLINPDVRKSQDELSLLFRKFLDEEASHYANAGSADQKLKTADEMYKKLGHLLKDRMDLTAPENVPARIDVKVAPEKVVVKNVPPAEVKKEAGTQAIVKKESSDFSPQTFITLQRQPYLNDKDSRVLKLNGTFKGKLKLSDSRTGLLENVIFAVNQDMEKQMTKFESTDIYDNSSIIFYKETNQTFRTVPGDENLLFLELSPHRGVILDLKKFPKLNGKLVGSKIEAEFTLEKIPKPDQ